MRKSNEFQFRNLSLSTMLKAHILLQKPAVPSMKYGTLIISSRLRWSNKSAQNCSSACVRIRQLRRPGSHTHQHVALLHALLHLHQLSVVRLKHVDGSFELRMLAAKLWEPHAVFSVVVVV